MAEALSKSFQSFVLGIEKECRVLKCITNLKLCGPSGDYPTEVVSSLWELQAAVESLESKYEDFETCLQRCETFFKYVPLIESVLTFLL